VKRKARYIKTENKDISMIVRRREEKKGCRYGDYQVHEDGGRATGTQAITVRRHGVYLVSLLASDKL